MMSMSMTLGFMMVVVMVVVVMMAMTAATCRSSSSCSCCRRGLIGCLVSMIATMVMSSHHNNHRAYCLRLHVSASFSQLIPRLSYRNHVTFVQVQGIKIVCSKSSEDFIHNMK